jgi:hypothetical protein
LVKLFCHDALLIPHFPTLATLRECAVLLNPYAAAFRYPREISEPEVDEFNEALAAAQEILTTAKVIIG